MVADSQDWRWDALANALTLGAPATPQSAVGRHDVVRRIFDAVTAPGSSAIVVGEPGLGKTSLLNVTTNELRAAGVLVLRAEAEPGMGFDALVRAAAKGVPVAPDADMRFGPAADDAMAEPLPELLPEGEAQAGDIATLLDQQLAGHPVLVIDGYEAVGTGPTDRAVADLIAALGETGATATVLLAANADTAEDVHANHDRTFRHLTEIPLRLLKPQETFRLLDRVSAATGIAFDDDARKLVLTASLGIPTAVQTLAQGAVADAIRRGAERVTPRETLAGMAHAAAALAPETRDGVDTVLGDDPKDDFACMIFAVAAAHTDWYGRFFKPQVLESLRQRFPDLGMGEDEVMASLDSLCGTDPMSLFRKGGSAYRFRTIWVKHYVLMRYLAHRFFGQSRLDASHALSG